MTKSPPYPPLTSTVKGFEVTDTHVNMPHRTIEVRYNPDMPVPDKNTKYVPYAGGSVQSNFIAIENDPSGKAKISFIKYTQADKDTVYEASIVGSAVIDKEAAQAIIKHLQEYLDGSL